MCKHTIVSWDDDELKLEIGIGCRAVGRGPYHQVEEHGGSSWKGDEQLELRL